MTNNIHLFDFNGSVRRNKPQEAILKDLGQKDEFLDRLKKERAERQLFTKKEVAAVKIQAAFRSFFVRRKIFACVRENFDLAGKADKVETLEAQIGRLSFFFSRRHDVLRTISLCSDAVLLSQQGLCMLKPLRRQQLLSCALSVLGDMSRGSSYVPLLRFIETFFCENDLENFCNSFFRAIISLFINHYDLPTPLEVKDWIPPRADAILHFILLPIRLTSSLNTRLCVLNRLLLSLSSTESDMHVVCYIIPFLGRVVKHRDIRFVEIVQSFSDEQLYDSLTVPQIHLMAYLLSVLTNSVSLEELSVDDNTLLLFAFAYFIRRISPTLEVFDPTTTDAESDSDEEDISFTKPAVHIENSTIGTSGFYIEHISTVLSSTILQKSFVESTLQSDEGCARLAAIIDFLHDFNMPFTSFLNAISLRREFILRLWHNVISLRSKSLKNPTQLFRIIEKGDSIAESDEVLLLPLLSLFVTLLSNMLSTADDDDLMHGGQFSSVIPFSIRELASVAAHFRDLTLGLIDIAFPVTGTSVNSKFSQPAVKKSKWSDIFKRVTSLTKMLYERDCRLHFMPLNFWSNHNRQVVVSSSLWRVGRRRQRSRGRPFEFVRFMLRERRADEEEEPPSPVELRNITILLAIPFVLPFIQRVEMFNEVIMRDKAQAGYDSFPREAYHVTVHRDSIYEDAFNALTPSKAPDLRNVLRVQMVNWSGLNEAGIDGGGIFREFMSELLRTVVDPSRGFFATTHDQMLYPNPLAMTLYPDFHDHFYFIGRIIAKLIYEGLLADLRFADFFILQWLGLTGIEMLDLEYVKSYDPLVHSNLKYLKYCSPAEVDALEVDFSVLVDNLGATEKLNLKKNGDEIKVTAENRSEYIALYVNFFLSKRIAPMLNALRAGVRSVIDVKWLRMFSPAEISILIGGIDSEIDFEDLKRFTTVHNIQSDDDKLYIESFWLILSTFSNAEKRKFLKFVTGCPRPPLMGFKSLNPPMGIQLLHQETDRLPSAGTCMNLLKLPVYPQFDILRSKLCFAINAGAGFELS